MALPCTRRQLKDWALRKLGSGVIDINISAEQCEDRLCEAIAYFQDYHYDGVDVTYLKHRITASTLYFETPITNNFQVGEIILGNLSNTYAVVVEQATDNLSLKIKHITSKNNTPIIEDLSNQFQALETITGDVSTTTAVLKSTNYILIGDIDNMFFPVDDSIISIEEIFPFNGAVGFGDGGIFDVKYQFFLNNAHDLVSTDIVSYHMFRKHLALLDFEFNGATQFRFNRVSGKIFLDVDWRSGELDVGDYIVATANVAVDPNASKNLYKNWFVREYTYILMKLQWANNMKKYKEIRLPGGVVLSGQEMYDEVIIEKEKIEEKLKLEFQLPVGDIFVG